MDLQALDASTFRLLFEATPHPYLILKPDPAFTIVAVNDRYLSATGRQRDEIVGLGLFQAFPDNPKDSSVSGVSDLRASLQRVVRDGVQDIMGVQKYDIPRAGGEDQGFEVKYWSPVNSPVFDRNGKLAYIVHHVEDVTDFVLSREQATRESAAQIEKVAARAERMEAEVMRRASEVKDSNRQLKHAMEQLERREEELARLNARLRELDRAKTEFFANVSHEFRTPLTLLIGPVEELLGDTMVPMPEAARPLLETAHRNALRLLKLVNSLLDFSRIEAGRAQPAWQAIDLAGFTSGLASNFRSLCERAGLTLSVDCPPLPRPVEVDPTMWEKILLNLLSNAFKFTFEGGIEVVLREVGGEAVLTVADTGIGIPKQELPHMFERFHRVAGARGRSYEGSGIGLALVRELVHLHGGAINVESEEGRGTRFTVQIPVGSAHEIESREQASARGSRSLAQAFLLEAQQWLPEAEQPALHAAMPVSSSAVSGRVLVADDNADMRAYIRRLLEGAGFAVETVADGQAALDRCRTDPPDLLLSDVMMPGMDGFALLRQLRAGDRTASLPVILLSAKAGGEARIEGLSAGADDYLVKPFPAQELVARVEGMIRLASVRREAEEAMRRLAGEIEDLYDNAPCGYHSLDREGMVIRMNRTELDWLGYPSSEMVGSKRFVDLLAPSSRQAFEAHFRQLWEKGSFHDCEYEMLRRDGSMLPVLVSGSVIADSDGRPMLCRMTVFDYTERRRALENLRQAATVFDNTDEAIIVADPDRRIVAVNRAFSRITGFEPEEVLGHTPRLLRSGRQNEAFYREMRSLLDQRGQWQGELWNRRKSGELFPAWENISVVRDEQGRITNYVAIFSDITVIKETENRLEYLAHHDALTGLPNRLLFNARLEQAIAHARRHGKKLGVFLLDLDRFKLINDTLGHAAGDQLLQAIGKRLQACVRGEDTVARLGGDEFALVINDMADVHAARRLAEKVIVAVAEPLLVSSREIVPSASVGVSLYPDHASEPVALLKAADAAMYRAKAGGRNTYAIHASDAASQASAQLSIEAGIRQALAQSQFELHYQPQVALPSGKIIGVEALLRWRHPTRGLVLPDEFIHVAEEAGLIDDVGEWVIDTALSQAALWSAQHLGPLRIAVNVSGRQLLHDRLTRSIDTALQRRPFLPPGMTLEFEITESVLLSQPSSTELLSRFKAHGLSIAIDDFGTGYSSLSRLKHLPVDTLKIDRAFIHDIPGAADNQAITLAIIALAHALGLKVVAEGVENEAQLDFLRTHGCDEAQGFAISAAVNAAAMTDLLQGRVQAPASRVLH